MDSTGYATTLVRGSMVAKTVEHLLATLHAYGVTNALIKVQSETLDHLAEAVAVNPREVLVNGKAPGETSLIGGGLVPTARLPLLLHPAHALALNLAVTRGCDPDAPRHLGQVVILGSE